MYALYVIGSQIENYFGRIKYLVIYLFSGLMGALFSMIFGGSTASIGASGAIFGLMGALLYFGYHYRVYLGNVLKTQLIPLILFNLVLGFVLPGVDNFAHIGGLIGGIIITKSVGVKDKSSTSDIVNGWIITTIFTLVILYVAFIYSVRG
jgi:rhomboid protease GluP